MQFLLSILPDLVSIGLNIYCLPCIAYNTFCIPILNGLSCFELVFGRKPSMLIDLETDPNIKVSGTNKENYELQEGYIIYRN